ncbi:hypothetical protein GCM10025787_16300 [Saccharopolyspora rosea]
MLDFAITVLSRSKNAATRRPSAAVGFAGSVTQHSIRARPRAVVRRERGTVAFAGWCSVEWEELLDLNALLPSEL